MSFGHLTDRLRLPLANFIGGRGVGTITTIEAGVFQNVDDRFPVATQEMLVSVGNALLFVDNEVVYL